MPQYQFGCTIFGDLLVRIDQTLKLQTNKWQVSQFYLYKLYQYYMRPNRIYSHKSQNSQLNKSHIVEAHLDRKSQLINKYQTETNDLMEQIQSKQPYRKAPMLNTDKSARKRALSSIRKDTSALESGGGIKVDGSLKEYNRLILGLQYSLEAERKKNEQLAQKNASLQSQISNLRNLLMGPDQQKHYEKTAYKQSQDRITFLEGRVIEQKKNYEFIIDSKNENITTLQLQINILKKSFSDKNTNNDQALSRRVLDLMAQIEQLKHMLTKKSIIIERLKYQGVKDEDSDDEEVTRIRKAERNKFYLQQLDTSNKLILKKNMQIIDMEMKVKNLENVLDVVQLYLDKKQVRGIDLTILQHPCVNKLRVLLRQKAVFEKQLLNQLNEHNKKIATFETQLTGRQSSTSKQVGQLIDDNKRLAATVTTLQSNIANLERQLENSRNQNQLLKTQMVIKKKQVVQQVTRLKDQLGTISNVTKNEFDRMRIENLKLIEQNRSLLFLVGEKERQIHKKGEAIKTFEQYRQKINTLNVGDKEKRKIEAVSEDNPQQIGTKLLTINNFSTWLFEWKKIKNWSNKKTLLNLILDKEEIRGTALESMNQLANEVINQCMLQSKNVQIQERGTILTSYFLNHNILQNSKLALNHIVPIFIRGFRPIIQGQDQSKCRLLNQSSLKIISTLSKTRKQDPRQSRTTNQSPTKQTYKQTTLKQFKWTYEMTNEMLAVNGLKYIFNTIRKAQVDQLVQAAYDVLIFIAKNNQMISFMMSYDLNTLIFGNLNGDYHFIIFLLMLVKYLLAGNDYLKAQNSVLEYRKIFDILSSDDDQQLLQLSLQCLLILMQKNTIFTRSLQKIKCISILSTILRKSNEQCSQQLLKQCSQVYMNIVVEMESENINKYTKNQIDKLLEVIKLKKFHQFRFNRVVRMLAEIVGVVQEMPELDEKIFVGVVKLYENYQLIDGQIRIKINQTINTIFQRNKQLLNKYSNQSIISNFIQSYKQSSNQQQTHFLLKILLFQAQQKRTTQLLRSGRQSMINKFVNDALLADYNVAILALKVLLFVVKEKYCEKFVNQGIVNGVVKKVLNQRGEEEYVGLVLSVLYFMGKVESVSAMVLEAGGIAKVCNVIMERHDKQQIIFKALAVLQVCHTQNYKKRVLNYLIASDNNLQILKTLNFSLRKSKNKVEMGTRAVFLYDYLNNPTSVQSLAILAQRNEWLIQDLIMLRNQYIGKVDGIVYKLQLLLHQMSQKSNKVKKLYQKYKVDGGDSGQDDD